MKKKVKKLNIARVLVLILIIYIIVCACIYIYKQPVRHYEIKGNQVLSDMEIIEYLHLENYPSYISINTGKLSRKLEQNKLVKKAKIKYGLNFKIIIEVTENTPVMYVKLENKICLASGEKIDATDNIIGIPTLLNSTPTNILEDLASNLAELDEGILSSISEIEYKPSYNKDNKVIDENRFLLSMNDNNLVYITSHKAEKLNDYLDIIATRKITTNGILYLDGDGPGNLFKEFGS